MLLATRRLTQFVRHVCMLLMRVLGRLKILLLFKESGKGSYIIRPMRIVGGENVTVGSQVSILHFLRLEVWKQNPHQLEPCVVIGDRTNIEQNVHITAGRHVYIGKDCSVLCGAVITDIIHPYANPQIPASMQGMICNPVNIGDQCFIGAHSIVMPGVTMGKHVIIGANSVVTMNLPAYVVAAGVPAKVVKKFNRQTGQWERAGEIQNEAYEVEREDYIH